MSSMSSIKYTIGETIVEIKPLVHTLKDKKKKSLCDHCFGPIVRLSDKTGNQCEECFHMFYCSEECKANDSRVHRLECPVLRHDYPYLAHDFFRLILRLYLVMMNDRKAGRTQDMKTYTEINGMVRTFADLKTNSEQIKLDAKRMQIFDYCLETIDFNMRSLFDLKTDKELLFLVFCKLSSNLSQIVGFFEWHKTEVIGSGLYIEMSAIGHSCVPNTAPIFEGSHMVIKAIKSINFGEELTMNYCQLDVCKEIRHEILLNRFYRECNCFKCHCQDFRIDYNQFTAIGRRIKSEVSEKKFPEWPAVSKLCDRFIHFCQAIYGEYHPQTVVYLLRVYSYKLQDKDRRSAMKLMAKLNVLIDRIYGRHHPLREIYDYCVQYKCVLDFE